jgi:uncharacterized OB-fold protein
MDDVTGTFAAQIAMPYTLTAGRAIGVFLAELARKRIIGSCCQDCGSCRVPAQDYCGDCGSDQQDLQVVPSVGTLDGFTTTQTGTLGLVRLDGTDVPVLHRILTDEPDDLTIGDRVSAVWAEPKGTVLDLAGFELDPSAPLGSPSTADDLAEPIAQQDYEMVLDFRHAFGHYYGALFDGISAERRIRGVRCPSCRNVLVPPREYCDVCFVPTSDWVDVPDTGVVQACSVVHIEFVGQSIPPPYVYAEIVLDGTATRLIHTVGGLSAEDARAGAVRPGSRVQAVWSDRRSGSLADIDHFRVIEPAS